MQIARPLTLCCFLTSAPVLAAPPVEFSSVYTDIATDCKYVEEAADEEGGDGALLCKGVGGYQGYIFFSASFTHLAIQDAQALQPSQYLSVTIKGEKSGKIEWRLANGKPFAVIVRTVEELDDGKTKPGPLVVQGLKGHSGLAASVRAVGNPKANEEARVAADAAYTGRKQ